MGTTLTGTTPANTYDSLIKVTDNGPLSGTAKYLSDGLGNDSALAVSTSLVGIGTNSGINRLSISGSGSTALSKISVTNTNTSVTLGLAVSNSIAQAFIGTDTNHPLGIVTNDLERITITSSGRVGIGTSSPNRLLTIKNSSDGSNGISFQSYADVSEMGYIRYEQSSDSIDIFNVSAYPSGGIKFSTNSAERMRITSAGNVGIGTSSPASPLSVGGTAIYNSPASTANFSTADAGKFQLRLTSSSFNTDGNWVGLGMGYHQDYLKTAIIARASDASARGTLNFCLNASATSANVTLADTRVSVTTDGLTFNGDTAAANALDDYEEGTFTAVITGGTFSSLNTGRYTKIGRQVYWYLSPTTTSITGNLTISSLPYVIADRSASLFATVAPSGITYTPQFHESGSAQCYINVSGTYSGGAVSTYFAGVYSV